MALIFLGKTECALCDGVIKGNDEIVSTSHFIRDLFHALWRFSDAAMHKNCFLEWNRRAEFVAKYNETMGSFTWGNGTYDHMLEDGTIVSLKRES